MIEFKDLFGEIKPKNDYSAAQAIIIYGNMGTGKTTLAASCSESGNTVLVNFEGRISHIDETEQLRIVPTSQSEFRENARCNYDQFVNFAEYVLENKVKVPMEHYNIGEFNRGQSSKLIRGLSETDKIVVEKVRQNPSFIDNIQEYLKWLLKNHKPYLLVSFSNSSLVNAHVLP